MLTCARLNNNIWFDISRNKPLYILELILGVRVNMAVKYE